MIERQPSDTSRCVIVFFLALLSLVAGVAAADEVSRLRDSSFDITKEYFKALGIGRNSTCENFFPLGFSPSGWFAYSGDLHGIEKPGPFGQCFNPPCYDVSTTNVHCGEECLRDSPSDANDRCYCTNGLNRAELEALALSGMKGVAHGLFPYEAGDESISCVAEYCSDCLPGEMFQSAARFPETILYVASNRRGKREFRRLDHNHLGIAKGVRPLCWIKNPYGKQLVILLLCQNSNPKVQGREEYFIKPVCADLEDKGPPS